MTDNYVIQAFGESRYTLIVASNFLPGFLLFELIDFTTLMKFSLEFKIVFAFAAGLLITEWFYESISIIFNLYTRKNRETYKKYLMIMSPLRILRKIATIDSNKLKNIQKSSYPQSMALDCTLGSMGWLLVFFTLLTWKGLFYILVGIPILVALKTLICAFYKNEWEWMKEYNIFLLIPLVLIILVYLIAHRQESEIIFMVSDNNVVVPWIYVFMIGVSFILMGSSYYISVIKKAIEDIM